MAVFALKRQETLAPGVYPFNSRKHLHQVVDLVSAVFGPELDEDGRNALQEIQAVGWLGPVLGGLLSSNLLGEFVAGYVWIEGGRVLGNVTLQRADYGGTRWRISNVAVAPEHRGRGIARSLMLSAISEIASQGGSWALLQVRVDNAPARKLYAALGFSNVCQDGIWKLHGRPANLPAVGVELQRLPALAWRDRLELAQAAQPQLASWLSPVAPELYRSDPLRALGEAIGTWTGLYQVQRWGVRQHGLLEGAVEVWASALGETHRLRLAVRPKARGRLEAALVSQGLRALTAAPFAPVVVEHSGDHAEGVAALEAVGFRPQRILLTMRRQITPADALI
jgi:ribosomal protein S18 acetylase RimI-like enzyme